jgi:hypothetical protein
VLLCTHNTFDHLAVRREVFGHHVLHALAYS